VFNNYSFGMSDSPWTVLMASSAGNYGVQFSTDGYTVLACTSCDPYLPLPGTEATISGGMVADFGASGTATIGSVFYPAVSFKGAISGVLYASSIQLQSSSFVMNPGDYAVPFTMTGVLYALTLPGPVLVLQDPIEGYGVLHFTLQEPGGPGTPLEFATIGGGPASELEWDFTPEPATALLVSAGLAAAAAAMRGRRPRRPAVPERP
jgi:hypothetical protein